MTTLRIRNFAQIADVQIAFGDLTVLVGPQATGKSLVLQWFKMALDAAEVVTALRQAGSNVKDAKSLLDLVFGEGMSSAWQDERSSVTIDGRDVRPSAWTRSSKHSEQGRIFYIPAHRALLLGSGWPVPFLSLNADTPAVARLFSQSLYQRFSGREAASLFPVPRMLKAQYRQRIDDAVYHGGKVELKHERLRSRLGLNYGDDVSLPFMTWTAGQREFTPLLLGLYHLLPPRKLKKRSDIDYVVIEEPEMGLHPQAIMTFMILVLDLLWRGYKVVLSTHSPLVLDTVWAIRTLAEHNAKPALLAEALGLEMGAEIRPVLKNALQATSRVHYLDYVGTSGRVVSRDISSLDPLSDDEAEADWGGLTGFSARLGSAVRRAVNASDS